MNDARQAFLQARVATLEEELQKARGERDAARALLREASPWLSLLPESRLRARICKELDEDVWRDKAPLKADQP